VYRLFHWLTYSSRNPLHGAIGTPESSSYYPHEAQFAAKPASPVPQSTSSAQGPPASEAPTSFPESISERIWNEAYDRLKKRESRLVDAYERVASEKIDKGEISTEGSQLDKNLIEQTNKEKRRLQMGLLVKTGMEKTEQEGEVKEGIGSAMKGILLFKDLVGQAVSTTPQGALAWTGVSLIMQVCSPAACKASADKEDYRKPIYGDGSKS
jgi:hypothetical protein